MAASTRPERGLVLTDRVRGEAIRQHLQTRLGILALMVAVAATVFYLVLRLLPTTEEAGRADQLAALVHLAVCVGAWILFLLLKRVVLRLDKLRLFDALLFALAAGGSLAWYAIRYERGDSDVIALLAIFLVGRAVLIPGTALRTILLALPLPVILFILNATLGPARNYDVSLMDEGSVGSYRRWMQITLAFGIVVAALASHVTFALRRELVEARALGPYQLLQKLGGGGMGEVWKARHAALKRPTAIKFLRPEVSGSDTVQRFENEVRNAARLMHPNVIQIYDYGHTTEGLFYYAMEYLKGVDLARLLETEGPLPPERVVLFLGQACDGLQAAHDQGLVHRDVKLENLFVFTRGHEPDVLKVVDFGLVKDLRAEAKGITVDGEFCGTLETIAPEVARGEPPTPACDLYGIGVVGCTLLTGEPVFEGSTPLELVGQHLHVAPVPPSARGVDVPPALEAVLLQCLAKDPAARPASARELAAALRASVSSAS